MTKRREAISAQLGSLRELMSGFGDDEVLTRSLAA